MISPALVNYVLLVLLFGYDIPTRSIRLTDGYVGTVILSSMYLECTCYRCCCPAAIFSFANVRVLTECKRRLLASVAPPGLLEPFLLMKSFLGEKSDPNSFILRHLKDD